MNVYKLVAAVLGAALLPCGWVALREEAGHGLVALQLASVILSAVLLLLAEGLHRQPFIDLAVVFSLMSPVASVAFARLMERDL